MLGLNINQTYQLKDGSVVNFSITDGKNKINQPAVVWQTQITNSKVKKLDEIKKWLESGHNVTSKLFKNTIKTEFYERFK